MEPTIVENQGYVIRELNICLIVFSTIIVAMRYYARQFMIKSMGWDDALAISAWVVLMVLAAFDITGVANGSGRHLKDLSPAEIARFFSILSTLELLYFVGTGLIRLSIVAFLPRLSREKKVMKITYILGSFIIAMTLAFFLTLLFECRYVPDLWDRLNPNRQCFSPLSESYLFWTHAALGIAVDVALFVIPIWLIYSRMILSIATVKVILVFGVGLFVIVTGIVRLIIIVSVEFGVDTSWQFPKLSLWADIEAHVGLWVACFPSLTPIIRLAAKKIGLRSKTSTNRSNAAPGSNWDSIPRGYVQSGSEVQLGSNQNSVFADDSSTKKIAIIDERDVEMEMDRIQSTKRH